MGRNVEWVSEYWRWAIFRCSFFLFFLLIVVAVVVGLEIKMRLCSTERHCGRGGWTDTVRKGREIKKSIKIIMAWGGQGMLGLEECNDQLV